jgi:hypothetical protein
LGLHGRAIGAGLALAATICALAPATASAAGLVAAYDRYVTGKGFEIGLVNALTGATLSLPAGVNTNDDELHPTLTPDGRYLVFMRTKLLPKLNGDIVPPAERTLFVADRQAGTVTSLARTGAGPVFASPSLLGWGVRPFQNPGAPAFTFVTQNVAFSSGAIDGGGNGQGSPPSGGLVETVHADHGTITEFDNFSQQQRTVGARYVSFAVLDPNTGALQSQTVQFTTLRFPSGSGFGPEGQGSSHGTASAPAGHPDVRSDDYVAFHMGGDIQTRSWPANDLAPAPEPITSSAPERDPAWSPDGLNLGFIRTSGGQRRLGVFNATPGIQTILNPLASLGPEAPTPQTRAYQEVWGGLSIAEGAPSSAPAITCDATCRARIQRAGSTTILSPTLSIGSRIGIFVARVVGRRTLLGRSAPRLRVVGRVPLGRAKRGRNRLRWNGKVDGKRLRPGTYLITYRSLKGRRVSNTSDSIRVTVGKGGKIRRARPERVPR